MCNETLIKYLIPVILVLGLAGILTVYATTQINSFQTIQFNQTDMPYPNPNNGSIDCYNQKGVAMINCFGSDGKIHVIDKDNLYTWSGILTTPGTFYQTVGGNHLTSIESYARSTIEANGELKYFDCLIDSNTMSGNTLFDMRINGGSTGIKLLIPGIYVGLGDFHHIEFNINKYDTGDLYLKIQTNSTGSISYTCHAMG